jgi:ABC-2 type transport system ATP-binding protein
MDAVLLAEGVRREYGETVALNGVSLSVAAGEVFALVGPNGAGKTTLVRALTGTTAVDGSVSVFGDSPSAVEKSRLGVLPQSFSPPARLSARELLAYYAGLYDDPRAVEGVLDDVGMAGSADTRYEDLSGGQQRRTCVGATLVNDPDLLVLDEPTTGIDPAGRRALWELLEGLAAGGTTILLTTHYMAEAERLADRVGLLADGSLAAVGTPSDLIAEYGGRTRLDIETDADATALDGLTHPVESIPTGIVVGGVSATDIGAVVAALERHGIEYGELAWRQPDLEDVYLTVTDGDGSLDDADEERSLTSTEQEAGAVQ